MDRDVVYDNLGIPYLPARRLRGLLRDAALEAEELLKQSGLWHDAEFISAAALFGSPGGDRSSPLVLGDGRVPEYDRLQEWLRYAVATQQGPKTMHREAVVRHFTETRGQTAMDPVTGGPLTDTLRVTRLLRPRTSFEAAGDMRLPDPRDETRALNVLVLACGALRRMGLSRNRGPGRVSVKLRAEHVRAASDVMADLCCVSGDGQ